MPTGLQKQSFTISLNSGIDTKTDPKQVADGRLLLLENAVFDSLGQLQKRSGYTQLSRSLIDGGNVLSGNSIFSFNNQLLLHDGIGLNSYDTSDLAWVSQYRDASVSTPTSPSQRTPAINVSQLPLMRGLFYQPWPDMTLHPNGYTVVASGDVALNGLYYSIYETSTNANIIFSSLVDAAGYSAKVISIGQYVLIFYVVANTLLYKAIDTTNITAGIGSPVTVLNNFSSTGNLHNYDVTVVNNTVCIAITSLAVSVVLTKISSTLVMTQAVSTIAGASATTITIFPDSLNNQIVVAWCDSVNVKYAVYNSTLTSQLHAPQVIETGAITTTIVGLTGVAIPGGTSDLTFFYGVSASSSSNYYIRRRTALNYSFSSTAGDLLRSVGLAGKAFYDTNTSAVYVLVAYEGPLDEQNTNFLVDRSGQIVAKALTGDGFIQRVSVVYNNNRTLPEVNLTGDSYVYALTQQFSNNAFGAVQVEFTFGTHQTSAILANTLHYTGGLLWMFDGVNVCEHGFHVFPEGITVNSPGGTFNYQWVAVYEWMDANGLIHQSSPSTAVAGSFANGLGGGNVANITLPTLRLTSKSGSFITIAVYRTLTNGTIFYRTNGNFATIINDTTADIILYTDGNSDSSIAANQKLYTTGEPGPLENIPVNSPAGIVMAGNRIWIVDALNPLRLWFSKEVVQGAPVEFNDLLTLDLEPRGPVTAIANLDDKTVVFRKKSISYVLGVGPTSNGLQNDFTEIQTPSDVGGADPSSIISSELGLMFKSEKGIYQIDRSMSTTYIGADVEVYNPANVLAAQLMPSRREIRFLLDAAALVGGISPEASIASAGIMLSYDTLIKQWSVYTNNNGIACAVWNEKFVYLQSNGIVQQETPGVYNDNGFYIPMRIKTGWVKLAGLQGFKRIWDMLILGDWKSAHTLTVNITFDFDGTIIKQTDNIDFSTQVVPLQWRIHCQQQQCQAIQVEIIEVQNGATVDQGLNLTALSFEAGIKRGLFKLPSTKSSGG